MRSYIVLIGVLLFIGNIPLFEGMDGVGRDSLPPPRGKATIDSISVEGETEGTISNTFLSEDVLMIGNIDELQDDDLSLLFRQASYRADT